ncbi:uncharacterized protein [Clytia hemisphaerica]|uniref:uncharacterized protein n=1 Tax=Clytia hemisphaerica TaxID=252671 RepID=UPI0034D5C74C
MDLFCTKFKEFFKLVSWDISFQFNSIRKVEEKLNQPAEPPANDDTIDPEKTKKIYLPYQGKKGETLILSFYASKQKKVDYIAAPIPGDGAESEDDLDNGTLDENFSILECDSKSDVSSSETDEEVTLSESDESSDPDSSDTSDIDEVSSKSKSKGAPSKKAKTAKKISAKEKASAFNWTGGVFEKPEGCDIDLEDLKPFNLFTPLSSPTEFVNLFLTDDFLEEIIFQTNLYNTQRSNSGYKVAVRLPGSTERAKRRVDPVTKEELRKVIGIILYMGIPKLPNRRMYWSPFTRVPIIADAMTRNRFEEILAILHFNDNEEMPDRSSPDYDRMYKLRPLIDHLNKAFLEAVMPETCQAVDEQMVPFKGHHGAKMYMPKKPVKWGYKIWSRAGVSGYVYEFEVCGDPRYHRIAFHLISLSVVNSYVIYREVGGTGSLLDFWMNVARSFLQSSVISDESDVDLEPFVKKVRSLKASQVPKDIRLDRYDHWPLQLSTPQRCKIENCTRRSRFFCTKCQVYLCVTGTDCFLDFHGVERSAV